MKRTKNCRVLAMMPTTRGFGFAVMEKGTRLVDWGVVWATKKRDDRRIEQAGRLIAQYHPHLIALPDFTEPDTRRKKRTIDFAEELIKLAECKKISALVFSRKKMRQRLLLSSQATKRVVAETLARRFSAELGSSLPHKRRPWQSELYRMGIFEAVALAAAVFN